MRCFLAAAVLAATTVASVVPAAGAQAGDTQNDLVGRAEDLRNAGDFVRARELLESHLSARPDDADAARLLAETRYWLQDIAGARRVYDQALARHPDDDRLRLAYARMLVETGAARDAYALLAPVVTNPGAPPGTAPGTNPGALPGTAPGALPGVDPVRADALTLLGTLAYWEGDLTTATRRFEDALAADPAQPDAARQLGEIRSAGAPWVRVSPALLHDDQPLDRRALIVEAGWFATPLVPIAVRVEPMEYTTGGATRRLWAGDVTIGHFAPRSRIETELAAGLLRRDDAAGADVEFRGRATAGLRLPRHATVRVRVERTPYLDTVASLEAPLSVDAAAAEIHWDDPRGWLAEAAYRRQWYPDGNVAATAYAWMLAPVARAPAADLQAGYAFSAGHARESRFVPVGSSGRYEPYYTPAHVVTHSATAALTLRPSPRATVRAGGSYALHAREDAPFFTAPLGVPERVLARRSFSPWTARASLELKPEGPVTVSLAVDAGRTAFYEWTTASATLVYRFMSAARPQAEAP